MLVEFLSRTVCRDNKIMYPIGRDIRGTVERGCGVETRGCFTWSVVRFFFGGGGWFRWPARIATFLALVFSGSALDLYMSCEIRTRCFVSLSLV